jgi:acyl dehydratase
MDHDGREAFGSWYDDYTVGDIYKHWPGRTVNEYDDTLFSMITMNHAPLHIDEHYMSGSQFGQRLVNGLFVISLVVGMTVREISGKAIANLEYETVKHLGPTFHGDTIYAETEILEKRESKSKNDRGILYVETRAWNQRDETILTLRRRVMIPKRGNGAG